MQSSQPPKPFDLDALVDPELKVALSKMPPVSITKETLPAIREFILKIAASVAATRTSNPYEHIEITTKHIPGPKTPENSPDVLVKIYKDKNDNSKKPGLLWIYAGGLIMNSPDSSDFACQQFASEAKCVVVSVGYRLAPEHVYPAAIEDCYAALVWTRDNAEELGIDVDKIAVAGKSSGGGLTAALALLSRDRNGPKICFQMPLYPMLDHSHTKPSAHDIDDARVWNKQKNAFAWESYLGDLVSGEVPPYASVSRATDLSNLPPTFTYIGTLDMFRDETLEYVSELARAQVPVEFHLIPGCFHGFELIVPSAQASKDATNLTINALKKAFAA